MKACPLILLSVLMTLAACQGNDVPERAAPPTAAPAQSRVQPSRPQSAVAVRKPEPAQTARQVREALSQSKPADAKAAPTAKAVASVSSIANGNAAQGKVLARKSESADAKAAPTESSAAKPVATTVSSPANGDAARGKALARKCQACHNFNDRRKVGPGLAGIVGRKVGIMPDMQYSRALKAGGWQWDEAHLAAWICDSKAAVKRFTNDAGARTKMPAQRICDPKQQADLIAFLKTI
ncbi:MAG: cytochrome c [Zetaproteobacteria bacterium]|nr:MAG: cytochrome c [Zetaproteobacteria bacterium]